MKDDTSPESCHRVGDALAAGNVWGDAALLEHGKDCEICARELAALKKRRDFRDAFPVLSSIADQSRPPVRAGVDTDDAKRRASRRHLFLMIAALLTMIGYFTQSGPFRAVSKRPPDGDETAAAGPPHFRIFNLENALFESKVEGATVRSALTRGVAAFQVDRMSPEQRFLLTLPDGDIEVRGTRFVVTVIDDKTQSVDVNDGTVALRLHDGREVVLTAGQRWPSASARPTLSFMHLAPSKDAAPPDPPKPSE